MRPCSAVWPAKASSRLSGKRTVRFTGSIATRHQNVRYVNSSSPAHREQAVWCGLARGACNEVCVLIHGLVHYVSSRGAMNNHSCPSSTVEVTLMCMCMHCERCRDSRCAHQRTGREGRWLCPGRQHR